MVEVLYTMCSWQSDPTGVENTCIVDETFKQNLHFQHQQQQQSYFPQYDSNNYPKETKADLLTEIDVEQRRTIQHLIKVQQSLESNQPFIPMIAENDEYNSKEFQQIDQHHLGKRKRIQPIQKVNDHSFAQVKNKEGINQHMISFTPSCAQYYDNTPLINNQQLHNKQLQKGQFQLENTQQKEIETTAAENAYDYQNILSILQHL